MKLKDNSGGFWTDLIIRNRNIDMIIKQHLMPDEKLTRIMAEEMISAIKGSRKHKLVVVRNNGKINYSLVENGSYSTGILKNTSPDGTPYEPLHRLTLKKRKWIGNERGASYILRKTSEHIFNGLHIKKLTRAPRGGKRAEIGWSGEDERIANIQNNGDPNNTFPFFGKTLNGDLFESPAPIPARPFRGISIELYNTIRSFCVEFLK